MDLALKRPSLTGLNLLQNKRKVSYGHKLPKRELFLARKDDIDRLFFFYLFYTQDSLSAWPVLELSMCAKDS